MMTRDERAAIIASAQKIREEVELMLLVLLPEPDPDATCSHPIDQVDDCSELGNELYRCRACGAESSTPFPREG